MFCRQIGDDSIPRWYKIRPTERQPSRAKPTKTRTKDSLWFGLSQAKERKSCLPPSSDNDAPGKGYSEQVSEIELFNLLSLL